MNDSRDSNERFDVALRRWAGRPPTVPPHAAATRVLARLDEDRRARPRPLLRRLAWATMAAAAALSLGVWQMPHGRLGAPRLANPATAGVVDPAPPLGEGVLLLWIDHDTPLYMTLEPPAQAGERNPS